MRSAINLATVVTNATLSQRVPQSGVHLTDRWGNYMEINVKNVLGSVVFLADVLVLHPKITYFYRKKRGLDSSIPKVVNF